MPGWYERDLLEEDEEEEEKTNELDVMDQGHHFIRV